MNQIATSTRPAIPWKLRTRTVELGRRTLVCGIVNITPDSFSDGGLYFDPAAAVAHALRLLDEGADLLDLGAESTRPGSRAGSPSALTAAEEQARLLPALEAILAARPNAILSVDTYKADTAHAALTGGAEIINDVSGFSWDPGLPAVCAQARCGVILMHTRGRPEEWKTQPQLDPDALLATIKTGLAQTLHKASEAGIPSESIVLDPGYGFGKRFEENFWLLARQRELLAHGRPLLAGVSRKSFLGKALAALNDGQPAPVEARETAGLAAMVAAILNGSSIVRVHRVREALEAARIADEIASRQPF